MRARPSSSMTVLTPLLLALSAAAQNVLVVDGAAGDLSTAVSAANNGDTLLVRGGPYVSATIDGKSLTILAEPTNSVLVQVLRVRNLTPTQTVVITGLSADFNASPIELQDCAGSVRLRSITFTHSTQSLLRVTNCADVALVDCSFFTLAQNTPGLPGNPGAVLVGSRVAAYDTTFHGGNGRDGTISGFPLTIIPAQPGGAGVVADLASILFLSHAELQGGRGGHGTHSFVHQLATIPATAGASGGAGLEAGSAYVLDSALAGGVGGTGGSGMPPGANGAPGATALGNVQFLPDTHLELDVPSHVRETQPITVAIAGTPGQLVWLGISTQSRWQLDLAYSGVFLFGPSARRFALGPIPASGVLTASLPTAALPAGVLARRFELQAVTRTAAGAFVLGSAGSVVVLDASF